MLGIPLGLLIHSCRLMIYERSAPFGERVLRSSAELKNVRVQLSRKIKSDKNGISYEQRGKLFYDCASSLPADAVFMEDGCESVIIYRGREYIVTEVKYIYSDEGLHHLEIELGGGA